MISNELKRTTQLDLYRFVVLYRTKYTQKPPNFILKYALEAESAGKGYIVIKLILNDRILNERFVLGSLEHIGTLQILDL